MRFRTLRGRAGAVERLKLSGIAEVQKMVKVYKAPIAEADAAVIVDYLAATY